MAASVPWSVSAVDPEAWATARDAARRSGLSVGEWLEAAIHESATERARPRYGPAREPPHAIERRLDDLADRLDHYAQQSQEPPAKAERDRRGEQAVLASIETLNQRIDALVHDMRAGDRNGPAEVRTAIQRLDDRIEDLLARSRVANAGMGPDVERKLEDISHSIETLTRRLEQENTRYVDPAAPASIDELDAAVADIMMRQSTLDGVPPPREPRRARTPQAPAPAPPFDLGKLESQLKTMADEMQALRRVGMQGEGLDAMRREIRALAEQLHDLAPRRSIEALEQSVDAMARRLDRAGGDRSDETLSNVAHALQDIRTALADVQPAESFTSVEKDLHDLSSKLDNLNVRGVDGDTVLRLQEQTAEIREMLSSALPSDVLKALVEQIEMLVQKFEHSAPAPDSALLDVMSAFDRRIEALSERIEAATRHGPPPDALDDIRARLDELQNAVAHNAGASSAAVEASLSAMSEKINAAESRLDNLTAIERGLNDLLEQLKDARSSVHDVAERTAKSVVHEMAAPGAAGADTPRRQPDPLETRYSSASEPEIVGGRSALQDPRPAAERPMAPDAPADVAPDYPLEPGSGAPRMRQQSAALRIAQSETALGGAGHTAGDAPTRTSDFIAAARRAAQAAAAEPGAETAKRREPAQRRTVVAMFGGGRRALLIALTAFLLIFTALRFFDGNLTDFFQSGMDAPPAQAPAPTEPAPAKPASPESAKPAPAAPEPAPSPQDRSSLPDLQNDALAAAPPAGVIGERELAFLGDRTIDPLTTGSTADENKKPKIQTAATAPEADAPKDDESKLPAALGTPALRAAAAAGHPVAAYEIGTRYLEGRGVRSDPAEAAIWLAQASANGSMPAAYRLGSMYEKGHGVPKSAADAKRYYTVAAEGGNLKAMHNLAVMHAEGIDGKPDFAAASRWFRMAAERGVRDSQYNLGVLYARGLGAEQNLAESYRWFALAANQGDTDAARKRDDVGKRLDVQSLVAAKLAVQTWTATPADASANEVQLKAEWQKAEASPRKRSGKK